jgi:hypothetical protein
MPVKQCGTRAGRRRQVGASPAQGVTTRESQSLLSHHQVGPRTHQPRCQATPVVSQHAWVILAHVHCRPAMHVCRRATRRMSAVHIPMPVTVLAHGAYACPLGFDRACTPRCLRRLWQAHLQHSCGRWVLRRVPDSATGCMQRPAPAPRSTCCNHTAPHEQALAQPSLGGWQSMGQCGRRPPLTRVGGPASGPIQARTGNANHESNHAPSRAEGST